MKQVWRKSAAVSAHKSVEWRSKMSDHVAYALLVYTGLQIFVTVNALKDGASSILPYFALVLLVGLIIPFCHHFEKRWTRLSDREAHDPALAGAFKRDLVTIWALAIGMPLAMTGAIRILLSL
ncbi:hypothetical protein [Qipengyuania atrilutea]|uniref:Uncharacterized protein n=1 Tax=Qipengyuania atrilutea TaxID=2744473 RepID=A0A850H473_9SPHN|nr:hypothetical protein [Actirhodobacter atriluteus]NVD44698.1 hypothetical protein [Actirhodobacter atriluteus]